MSGYQTQEQHGTYHLKKDGLHKHEPISRAYVHIFDDRALEITVTGTIEVKMFDDAVRTIQDEQQAKNLRKNLLSLGQIVQSWMHTHVENGIINIIKKYA